MRKFKQMTREDRIKMETLLNAGMNQSAVAQQLGFNRSTISREYQRGKYMHRNDDWTETERYSYNLGQRRHDEANESKGKALKIGKDIKFANFLEYLIADKKYSPEAALAEAQRSKKFITKICLRTLYRYIDAGIFFRVTNKNLPIKSKRRRIKKVVRVQKKLSAGESITNRPKEIETRKTFGHWEMDTVEGKRGVTKSCLLVLTERKTRHEIIIKLKNKKAVSVVRALDHIEKKWGSAFKKVFKSITVDNGTEFSDYYGMEKSATAKGKRTIVYYCHAYASWERGTNENNNRLIRRHIPKGTDFDGRSQEEISKIEQWINDYPRKIFEFRTANEEFEEQLALL